MNSPSTSRDMGDTEWTPVINRNKRKSEPSEQDAVCKKNMSIESAKFPQEKKEPSNTGNSKMPSSNLIRVFQEDNKGPYTVWIRPILPAEGSGQNQAKSLSPFKVGKLICKKYININYICSKQKSTVEVNFKYAQDANSLVNDPLMESNNLRAFIPSFRLVRRGLVKGIDEDIPEEEIKEHMESEFKVLNVMRLNKRNRDPNRQENDPKWLASKSVVITFSGQSLPREVFLHKIRIEVEPYLVLPTVCYNCFGIGHASKVCRGVAKCSMCGEAKHNGNCTTVTPKCANCKGDHMSTDRKCMIYCKEYEIKRLMAYDNIAFSDARKMVFSKAKRNLRTGMEEFPGLQSKPYTPFNEVVRNQKNQSPPPKQKETRQSTSKLVNSNQFYKFQKDNCEDFIGPRTSFQSPKGIALMKENNPPKDVKDNSTEFINSGKNEKFSGKENSSSANQRPVLKDIPNNSTLYLKEKKEAPHSNSPSRSSSSKSIRTYPKATKDSSNIIPNTTK